MIAAAAVTLLTDTIRAHPTAVLVMVAAAVVAALAVWLLTGRADRADDADPPRRPLPPSLRPRGLIYRPAPPSDEPTDPSHTETP